MPVKYNMDMTPSQQSGYLNLLHSGELERRVKSVYKNLKDCEVCPHRCGVDRLAGELGVCKTGEKAQVASYGPHPGEERPISGRRGSGTIFFARCNLRCVFCQNADISQLQHGREYAPEDLAEMMLALQKMGCHNINLVSPSHVVPQIMSAVLIAAQRGLTLPLVFNTGGYDSLETLSWLDGIVDIYMPDMKFGDEATARKYSLIPDYPEINQRAVLEMQQQVGDLEINQDGIATRGLLVRHLVLPNDLANSEIILRFLAQNVSKNVVLNIMAQYHPAFKADKFPLLNRRISPDEYRRAVNLAKEWGLTRVIG